MRVHQLIDILSEAEPWAEIYLVDEKTVFEVKSADIAPETGNVFLNFINWYKELLKEKGYLHEPSVPPISVRNKTFDKE